MWERVTEQTQNHKKWWALGLSLTVGIALMFVAVRNLEVAPLQTYLLQADYVRIGAALAVYVALFGGVHGLRLWRWRYLLGTVGDFSPGEVLRAAAIGSAAILLLPLRLGEFVRPYLLSRETGCSMSAAVGTAVVERVVDGLCITFLLFVTLTHYDGEGSTAVVRGLGVVCLLVFGGAFGVCLAALWGRAWVLSRLERALGWISKGLAKRVVGLLGSFLEGVEGLRQGKALGAFVGMTLAYWGLNGLSIAFLASWGFALGLSPWEGMTVLAILVVGIMIPTGPALAGNYELFTLEALGLFVAPSQVQTAGAAFVAAMHLAQFFVQVLPAIWLVRSHNIKLREVLSTQEAARTSSRGL